MRTLVYDFVNPTPGDLIIINYEAPAGGKSSVKHKVRGQRLNPIMDDDGNIVSTTTIPADTSVDVATTLAMQVNKEWLPELTKAQAKPESGQLVIKCTDLLDNVKFSHEVHGEGGTNVLVLEF